MFQMVMPWVLEGDDSHLKGPLRIAGKDMRFYTKLAEQAPAAAFIAQAVNQTLHLLQHARPRRPLPAGAAGAHSRAERRENPRSLKRSFRRMHAMLGRRGDTAPSLSYR